MREVTKKRKANWGLGIVRDRLDYLIHFLRPSDRILDLGCGQGAYVAHLASLGYPVLGIDIFEYPNWREHAYRIGVSQESLFRVVEQDSPVGGFNDNEFNVVTAFEVLEHSAEPMSLVEDIRRVCQRDFFCSVPDCGESRVYRKSLGLHHWTDTTHVQFFTRASLVKLLQDTGFDVLAVRGSSPLDINSFYWEECHVPAVLKRMGLRLTNSMNAIPPDFYVSILAHCRRRAHLG